MSNSALETELPGSPSDDDAKILETGRGNVSMMYVSMSRRHTDGRDAEYLRWHTLDHRPEQYRLSGVKSSLRIASTPACRAVRAASDASFDEIDHVMTYFFEDMEGLQGFSDLAVALNAADRMQFSLPAVQQGVYLTDGKLASPRIKAGADVLPWWPAKGIYLLVETGRNEVPEGLCEVPGVAGLWSAGSIPTPYSSAPGGQQITYLFLDDDPVETAVRLRPVLERSWENSTVRPLLAAPFYVTVPYEWDRYVP